jgi:hypothetical protein
VRFWDVPDIGEMAPDAATARLRTRVHALLDELAAGG